ncbi:MAG TPA: FtsQ-type POTRA domain-containing protein [Terrimesophilobacter sp.]|nr:FtsQ-type POTRA domain-containing protein [Terrimesophilobacter sp.]
MKRPEGFGGRPQEPEPVVRPAPGRRGKQARASTPSAPTAAPRPGAPKPSAPRSAPARSAPATASERPSRQGRAAKELRSASRDRRRYEKREIRRFTRRARNRRLGWAVAAGVVVVLVALLAVAVYSPLLALRTIRIEGTSAVSADEVMAAVDGQLGTPLALIDYDRIRTELDGFPLIRSFVTEVLPPATLVVRIVERAPVGTIATPAGFAVVDPAGVPLSTSAQRMPGVPLIDVGSKGVDSTAFRAVVEVLLALPDAIRARVDTAQATSKDDVSLVLAGVGQRVVWGSADRSALKARVLQDLMATQGENAKVEFDVSAPLSPVVRPR